MAPTPQPSPDETSTAGGAPPLAISVEARADSAVCFLAGVVDAATAAQLGEELQRLIGEGVRHFLLDLQQVTDFGAVGLGVITVVKTQLADDGSIRLSHVPPDVRRVLEASGDAADFLDDEPRITSP